MHVHPAGYPARRRRGRMIDGCAIVPIAACTFALIVSPLLGFLNPPGTQAVMSGTDPSTAPRILWPLAVVLSLLLAARNHSRLSKLTWPPHIICLLAYLAFAGASTLWAFSPESSLVRFVQQAMVVISVVLPAMIASRTVDIMRGLFLCFALASVLNAFFVLGGSEEIARYGSKLVEIGYPGYFLGKNYLGECTAVTFLLALHEMRYPGLRRALGVIITGVAIYLVVLSDSKTAFGLAFICPFLSGATLIVRRITRLSPALILGSIPFCYIVLSHVSHFNIEHLSYMLYGDSTFTGRTIIWYFTQSEIAQRPILGWGYQSFWLVPGSPSASAPGWVKMMPNSHNGYYDTMLEMGHVGLAFLLVFIVATLDAIGRIADRNPARARLVLSLALYFILYNFLESLWMRGFEFLWVMFLFVVAEVGRSWQPLQGRNQAWRSSSERPGNASPLPGAQASRLRAGS
jgi:exopolysaccharide production protein ExoQ